MKKTNTNWSLVQDFIHSIEFLNRGGFYHDCYQYHHIAGARSVLCEFHDHKADELFDFCSWAEKYLRTYKKGDQYSPEAIACMLGYALRFSLGNVVLEVDNV
jgi:hypothetical protein